MEARVPLELWRGRERSERQVCSEGGYRSCDYKEKPLLGEGHFHLLGVQVPPLWANPILSSVQGRAQAVGQLVGLSCPL